MGYRPGNERTGLLPPFKATLITFALFVSFLMFGLQPATDVSASHEVIVTIEDTNDQDRIVPTDNQTEDLKFRIDYSDAASGDDIDNISLWVPPNWRVMEWSAEGDNGNTDYWEDEDGNPSDAWNWIDFNDVVGPGFFNLTGYGSRIIAPTNAEDIEIRVRTPPGTMSEISNWTLNLTDDNSGATTHYLYIIAADADDTNGYDIAFDVRDGREATMDDIIDVNDSVLILPQANLTAGAGNGLDTNRDEAPDYVNPLDVLIEDPILVNGSGLILWEDNEDTGGHFFSQVTGGMAREDVDDSQNAEDDYFAIVYPKNESMSPMKLDMKDNYNTNPGNPNALLVMCENLEVFRDQAYQIPHRVFTTTSNGFFEVYMTLTGESRGGGDDGARREAIIEVGDYTDRVTGGESGVDLRDSGPDGIYLDNQDDPMDISNAAGFWASTPINNTTLRAEADGNDDDQISFRYILVDNTPPSINSISIASNKSVYFFANDTDMLNGDDNVWFNSLAGEGGDQNATIAVNWADRGLLNISGSQAFSDTPVNDSGSGTTWDLSYTIEPGSGNVVVTVTVTDEAGLEATYSLTFRVDNIDPTPPSNVQARPDSQTDVGEYDDDPTIYVTWQNGTDSGSGMREHRMGNFSLWSDNIAHVPGDNENGEEGLETFYVFAVDNVGNVRSAPNDTITIDLTSPVITNISITSDRTWFYDADTDMAGGNDLIYFNSKANEGSGQVISINVTWTELNMNDSSGENAFGDSPTASASWWVLDYSIEDDATTVLNLTVTVQDKVGRTDTYVVDFIQDNNPPSKPQVSVLADPIIGYDDDGNLNTSWTEPTEDGSGLANYEIRIDSGSWTKTTNTSANWNGLSEGPHIVEVRALDMVGNVGETGNATVIVDTIAPVITDIQVSSSKPKYFHEWDTDMNGSDDLVYFNSLAGEGSGQIITITVLYNETNLKNIAGSTAFGDNPQNSSGKLTYSIEADASTETVTISVIDIVLLNVTYDLKLVQDNIDPVVNAGPDLTLKVGQDHTFDASDASDNVLISIITWFFGDGFSEEAAKVNHSYDSRGSYTALVKAEDLVGNIGNDSAIVLTNTEPFMDPIPDQILYENISFVYNVTASDPDDDLLTYSDDTGLFDIDPASGKITVTPTAQDIGTHQVNISVTDGLASFTRSAQFTVLPINSPPILDGIPNLIITRFNTDYFFDLIPYVEDDHLLEDLSTSVSSEFIHVSEVNNLLLIMNYPNSMEGKNEVVTVTVDDGEFTDDDTFTVTIGSNYPPEIIIPIDDQTFPEDTNLVAAFDLDDHFKDSEDLNDLNYSIVGNIHVQFDIATDNKVDISSDENWFGIELVTIRAFDSGGAFAEDSFTVVVTPVNDPPVFQPISDLSLRYEDSYVLRLPSYLHDADHDLEELDLTVSTTYASLSANHSWLTFWYPRSMDGQTDVVTMTASDGYLKDEVTFNVLISDNYPPVLDKPLPDVTFDEDTVLPSGLRLNEYFSDKDGLKLRYEVNGNHSIFVALAPNGRVDFSAQSNYFGSELMTFKAIDTRGAFVEDDVLVMVRPVNDLPMIGEIPDQTGTVGKLWTLDLANYITDVDNEIDELTVTTQSPSVSTLGTILLFQYDDAMEDIVLITVSDGDGFDQTSIVVRVQEDSTPPPPPTDTNLLIEALPLILLLLIVLAALLGFMFASSRRKKEDDSIPMAQIAAIGEEALEPRIVQPKIVALDEPEDITLSENYMFEDDDTKKIYRTVEAICDGTVKAVIMTNKHPKKLEKKYDLRHAKIFWLSDLTTDVETLDPSRLDFEIMNELSTFMKAEKENAVVTLDGVRQMIMATSYNKVLEFLKDVAEVASSNASTLLVRLNPNHYSKKELTSFEDLFDEVRKFTVVEYTENGNGEGSTSD